MDEVLNTLWPRLHDLAGVVGRGNNAEFRNLFQRLVKQLEIRLFLEVGAHEASISKELLKLMPQTKIFAYEANPFVFEKYKTQQPEGINYVNSAIGVDNSPKTFHIPRQIPTKKGDINLSQLNTTSSLRARSGRDTINEQVVCECTTIDSVMALNDWLTPSAIWVDVEGAVSDVLFGAHFALQKNIAIIFVEVEEHLTWTGQWLASDVTEYLHTKNFIPIARDCETTWQYNKIFINKKYLDSSILKHLGDYVDYLVSCASVKNTP